MDGRRCFIRMGGRTTLFYMHGWGDMLFYKWVDGRTTLFYKDRWMDGRRCFIRMGGRTTLFYKEGWTDDVVL